jgi:hypothetical protein
MDNIDDMNEHDGIERPFIVIKTTKKTDASLITPRIENSRK